MTLSVLVSQFPALISRPILPYFSEQLSLKNHENINSVYRLLTILISLFIFPISFFFAAFSPKIIPLVYGDNYLDAVIPSQILVITAALSFGTIGTHVVMALERSRFMTISGLVGGALLSALCVVLVPEYGSVGASVARLLAQSCAIAWGLWYINYRMNIGVPIKAIGKIVAAATAGAIVAYSLVSNIVNFHGVILGLCCGLATYTFCLRTVRVFNGESTIEITEFIRKLPKAVQYCIDYSLRIK
jgi:O-antigen/teichoic acid export membrane protein